MNDAPINPRTGKPFGESSNAYKNWLASKGDKPTVAVKPTNKFDFSSKPKLLNIHNRLRNNKNKNGNFPALLVAFEAMHVRYLVK